MHLLNDCRLYPAIVRCVGGRIHLVVLFGRITFFPLWLGVGADCDALQASRQTHLYRALSEVATTQSPLPTDWWRHARGLALMACQRAPAPLTSVAVPGSGRWPVHQQRQ